MTLHLPPLAQSLGRLHLSLDALVAIAVVGLALLVLAPAAR
jgi:hypothetical protein